MKGVNYKRIDHLAIAVVDLEKAIDFYCNSLGMTLKERRETKGEFSGMLSAVVDAGPFTIVLIQGTEPTSQVCRYIDQFGQGVQHVAFEVEQIENVAKDLVNSGVEFATDLLVGQGLKQIFSKRDPYSGMMFELIERRGEKGFQEQNVNQLFQQLERGNHY